MLSKKSSKWLPGTWSVQEIMDPFVHYQLLLDIYIAPLKEQHYQQHHLLPMAEVVM